MTDICQPIELAKGTTVKCPKCDEPYRWHIIGGSGSVIDPELWHRVTEGFLKPSDIIEVKGTFWWINAIGRRMPARVVNTRTRSA